MPHSPSRDDFADQRQQMVAQIAAHTWQERSALGKATLDPRVLEVMARVPRHAFVPSDGQARAHDDRPLPIGCGKTISQPFIVAVMTDLLEVQPDHCVLEIGTGLGYQTAVLAALAAQVYSVERLGDLAQEAKQRLAAQDLHNVETRAGNGFEGWPEQAPFDRIMVTGAPVSIPPKLVEQLRPGGRLVLPVGPNLAQQLTVVDKDNEGRVSSRALLPVRFSTLEDSVAD